MESLLVERADGVVMITFNRPEKKNAISAVMWRELRSTVHEIASSRSDRVVVFTGSRDSFCAGQDLTDPGNQERLGTRESCLELMQEINALALAIHELPQPTIAAVNGVAAGAGANLALGCDLIVAGASARFSQIFAQRGLTVDFGGSWLLPRLLGLHKAKELALFAEIMTAAEAAEFGIVNRVVPDDALADQVQDWARRLAAGPPLALAAIKQALNDGLNLTFRDALDREAVTQADLFTSRDAAEAFHAFAEKRPPTFRGE